MSSTHYYVYILLCENGHYYTGYTNNLERRYQEHLSGSSNCKYTQSFKPIKILQAWRFTEKSQAMRVEYFIKQLSKKSKVRLVSNPHELINHLEEAAGSCWCCDSLPVNFSG